MRELDRRSAAAQNVSEFDLMERAGYAAFNHLRSLWPMAKRVALLCGTGNNGGDGWIVARLLLERGLSCDVFLLGQPERISGAALRAYESWRQLAPQGELLSDRWFAFVEQGIQYDVVVDALVGIGIQGPARPGLDALIESVNRVAAPVLSLDVPSGLNADTGAAESSVIEAHSTITFIAMKQGLLTGRAPDLVGELTLDPLGTPLSTLHEVPSVAQSWAHNLPPELLKPRRPTAHKGAFGHVLVVGGNVGMGGAAILAAAAALRGGAGRVTLATRSAHLTAAIARHPEVMTCDIELPERLFARLQSASAVVIGPGLGADHWSAACLRVALESNKPLVVDADALNLLAKDARFSSISEGSVLTPHPGEAARLANVTISDIESDRFHWAKTLARHYKSTIILKGAGSIVSSYQAANKSHICTAGNPGMATGGMGDVLAGLVGALLAQGYDPQAAALGGTIAHATAGDRAWQDHGVGVTASDVINHLGTVLTPGLDGSQRC